MRFATTLALIITTTVICLLVIQPRIARWERANAYPYGRMCDPNIFNAYHSTCPAR